MIKTRDTVMLSLATAGLAVTAACSSSGGSGASGPVPPATGDAVSAQSTSLGTILVDGKGRTVYVFANDKTTASTCTGACAAVWPAVSAPATLPTSLPGVTGALGVTTGSGGGHQLTVAGHPVYTFSGDSTPGQTKGQGLNLNGGVWTVVSPSGAPDANATPAGGATPAPGAGY
jgi:predicted lipoprotein with Yx(FWY)xxD motif